MRAIPMYRHILAGLVGLSLSTTNCAQAQEALWFQPTTTAVSNPSSPSTSSQSTASADAQMLAPLSTTSLWFQIETPSKPGESSKQPAAFWNSLGSGSPKPIGSNQSKPKTDAEEVSFNQRFGGLLGQPKVKNALATSNEPSDRVSSASDSSSSSLFSQPPMVHSTAIEQVPWKKSATEPFSFNSTPQKSIETNVSSATANRLPEPESPNPQTPESRFPAKEFGQHTVLAGIPRPTGEAVKTTPPPTQPPGTSPAQVHKELTSPSLPLIASTSLLDAEVTSAVANQLSNNSLTTEPAPRSAGVRYALADEQSSASDRTEESSRGRPANSVTQESSNKANKEAPLLQTDSMIGPLKGADSLFGRLELEDDLRNYAAPISTAPRADEFEVAWMPAAYTWISPAFYHKPLYFEQPNLERYGVGCARIVQPILSPIHFFGSIPLVPYKTLTHHPREKVFTLGQGRPGNCVPVQRKVLLGQSTVGEVFLFWEECSGYR